MDPRRDQIELAAYRRWERRGWRHGGDRADWLAAEKDLRFTLNYRWIAREILQPIASTAVPDDPHKTERTEPKLCRYCEQVEPSTSFTTSHRIMPVFLDLAASVQADECDECRAHHETELAPPFEAFVRSFLEPDLLSSEVGATIPSPALKALVRLGLALLPETGLPYLGETLEWVTNPDHASDHSIVRSERLGCRVYRTPEPLPAPFASIASRVGPNVRYPHLLFFLGARRVVFQTYMPFSTLDEDVDDECRVGPALSMSMQACGTVLESISTFVPAVAPGVSPPVG
jgi:hypothetical protein